jgi:hypothetical protein
VIVNVCGRVHFYEKVCDSVCCPHRGKSSEAIVIAGTRMISGWWDGRTLIMPLIHL